MKSFSHSRPRGGKKEAEVEKLTHFETLASAIETSEQDDSMAIEHSLIRAGMLEIENDPAPWTATWRRIALILLAAPIAAVVWPYQLLGAALARLGLVSKTRVILGPRTLNWLAGKLIHPLAERVREGVVTSAALDVIYSTPVALANPQGWRERAIAFLLNQPDGQGVRNRLRYTYLSIRTELDRLYRSGRRDIRMVTLACGSAQASIEAVADFIRLRPDCRVGLLLVDLSEPSLRRAARLAQARGVADCVEIRLQNLRTFLAESGPDWDIVEMVGFLDYRSRESVMRLCGAVRGILVRGGLFIGAHIAPSPLAFNVRWAVNWPLLVRRSPEAYEDLLLHSGWSRDEVELWVEFHRIHAVSCCRKRKLQAAA